jgi:voltage-gated potassium channel
MRKDRVPIVLLAELEEAPMEDDLLFFYYGSPTRESDLRRVNIAGARSVVLLADETSGGANDDRDAKTVLAALTARSLNADVMITAEVLEPENVQHMKRAGVQEVFDHNLIGGNLLAQSAMRFGVIEFVTALAEREANAKIFLIAVPDELQGKRQELHVAGGAQARWIPHLRGGSYNRFRGQADGDLGGQAARRGVLAKSHDSA